MYNIMLFTMCLLIHAMKHASNTCSYQLLPNLQYSYVSKHSVNYAHSMNQNSSYDLALYNINITSDIYSSRHNVSFTEFVCL